MKNSVRLVDQAMATKLEQATQSQLRAVAKGVCLYVLVENQLLSEVTIVKGVEALENGDYL